MKTDELSWDLSNENFCLWDWNLETGTIGLSHNWLEILGVALEEYEPSSEWFNSLIHPEDVPIVLLQLEGHLSGSAQQTSFIFRLKNKHNEYLSFESKGFIILQADSGNPGHVVWACEKVDKKVYLN